VISEHALLWHTLFLLPKFWHIRVFFNKKNRVFNTDLQRAKVETKEMYLDFKSLGSLLFKFVSFRIFFFVEDANNLNWKVNVPDQSTLLYKMPSNPKGKNFILKIYCYLLNSHGPLIHKNTLINTWYNVKRSYYVVLTPQYLFSIEI
jgi:hypothetical protein